MRPTLHTERLILRPFAAADADAVTRLASAREIAATTLSIPHPYERGFAETWIASHQDQFAASGSIVLAITLREDGTLAGAIGLDVEPLHRRAELGYWVGLDYWGRGYCTEAALALVRHGFETMGLHRILAHHFSRNPASGRVMQKIGLRHEGTLRGHVLKWGVQEDLELYGMLHDDFARMKRTPTAAPLEAAPRRAADPARSGA